MKIEKKDGIYIGVIILLLAILISTNTCLQGSIHKLETTITRIKGNYDRQGAELKTSQDATNNLKEINRSAREHIITAIGIIDESIFTEGSAIERIDAIIRGLDELEKAFQTDDNSSRD